MRGCAHVRAWRKPLPRRSNCTKPKSPATRQRRARRTEPRVVPAKAGTTEKLSERTLAQARHIGRPRAGRRPVETAVLLRDLDVVDAGLAAAHQTMLVELPLF